MNQMFAEAFPELNVQAPTLMGQTPMQETVLTQLRRQQLHDLAKAYEIVVKPEGTKAEILPALVAAEGSGVFTKPAVHAYWLLKAAYNPDVPHLNNQWGKEPASLKPKPDQTDFRKLQMEGKRLAGVLGHRVSEVGMTKEQLEAAVEQAQKEEKEEQIRVESEGQSAAKSLLGHSGVPGQGGPLDRSETDFTVAEDSGGAGPVNQE